MHQNARRSLRCYAGVSLYINELNKLNRCLGICNTKELDTLEDEQMTVRINFNMQASQANNDQESRHASITFDIFVSAR